MNFLEGLTGIPGIAQIPGLTITLADTLTECGGNLEQAIQHAPARDAWNAALPESRAAILLSMAYGTREGGRLEDAEGAGVFALYSARELNRMALEHTGGSETFHGRTFPAMPLPGVAGRLASMLAFDRDTELSLDTALVLMQFLRDHTPDDDGQAPE